MKDSWIFDPHMCKKLLVLAKQHVQPLVYFSYILNFTLYIMYFKRDLATFALLPSIAHYYPVKKKHAVFLTGLENMNKTWVIANPG